MSGILQSIGAISIIWGILWLLWDKNAVAPARLMGFGLLSIIAGSLLV